MALTQTEANVPKLICIGVHMCVAGLTLFFLYKQISSSTFPVCGRMIYVCALLIMGAINYACFTASQSRWTDFWIQTVLRDAASFGDEGIESAYCSVDNPQLIRDQRELTQKIVVSGATSPLDFIQYGSAVLIALLYQSYLVSSPNTLR